ncbi:hypothetical protein FB451DRAFT_1196028 [Mycena latifolia]|nr:hypothetical protein FB451DRAFT_1196028 [Mycena latifolia]
MTPDPSLDGTIAVIWSSPSPGLHRTLAHKDTTQVVRTRPYDFFFACSVFTFLDSAWGEVDENQVYSITVTSYSRTPDAFIFHPPRSLILTLLFTAVLNLLVQVFFANRIRVLSGWPHIFLLCLAMAALRFICNMALIPAIWRSNTGILVIESTWYLMASLGVALAPVGDSVIALSMCYYLWNTRESGSQFRRSLEYEDSGGYAHDMDRRRVNYRCHQVRQKSPDIQAVNVSSSIAAIVELILMRSDFSYLRLNGRARFRSTEDNIILGPVFESAAIGTRSRRVWRHAAGHNCAEWRFPQRGYPDGLRP